LKYHCLDKCRTPLSFIMQHWHGITPRRDAFLLGTHHGVFCVGCCWAIMLLMFVVGTGNVDWMLVLGGVMGIEKNASWGKKLSRPLGLALIAWGALIVGGRLEPTKYETILNLETGKAPGFDVPSMLLTHADEMIESSARRVTAIACATTVSRLTDEFKKYFYGLLLICERGTTGLGHSNS